MSPSRAAGAAAGDLPRRSLLLLGLALPALAASGCSAGDAAPRGWNRVLADDVSLLVRNDWEHSPAQDGLALFTDLWREDGGAGQVVAVGTARTASAANALQEGIAALRAALPGFRVASASATAERSGTTIAYLDVASASPDLTGGRLWALAAEGVCAVVLLGAARPDAGNRRIVEDSLRLETLSGAPRLAEDWARVGRGATTLGVPRTWSITGAVHGSERWLASWADADPDGFARALVVLCPDTGKQSAVDALAQIEADDVAGALPGFQRAGEPSRLDIGEDDVSALRLAFTYGAPATATAVSTATAASTAAPATATAASTAAPRDAEAGTGVLWVLQRNGTDNAAATVSAVQLALARGADESVVEAMEASLWLIPED